MLYKKNKKNNPKKVINKEVNKENQRKKNDKKKSGSNAGLYYSFLTIVLFLCLLQVTVSAVLNISKIVSYNSKIKQITHRRDAAQALKDQLTDSINNFSNVTGIEAIARNNLKMSSEDEVLVIINSKKDDETETKKKNFWER